MKKLRMTMFQRICLSNVIGEQKGKRSDENHVVLQDVRKKIKPSKDEFAKCTLVYGNTMAINEPACEEFDSVDYELSKQEHRRLKDFLNGIELPGVATDWIEPLMEQLEAPAASALERVS